MAKPPNRIRTNDPIGLRNRVLDAAAARFQADGFGATSVHDLVRATGISGGALHHHFPTKKSLALAVIGERVAAEVTATWIDRIAAAPSAAAGIVAVFDQVADALGEHGPVGGCPLGNLASELALGDADLRLALASEYASWRAAIVTRVEGDLSAGRAAYADGDAIGVAYVAMALFTGALTLGKAEQTSAALRSASLHLGRWMESDL